MLFKRLRWRCAYVLPLQHYRKITCPYNVVVRSVKGASSNSPLILLIFFGISVKTVSTQNKEYCVVTCFQSCEGFLRSSIDVYFLSFYDFLSSFFFFFLFTVTCFNPDWFLVLGWWKLSGWYLPPFCSFLKLFGAFSCLFIFFQKEI